MRTQGHHEGPQEREAGGQRKRRRCEDGVGGRGGGPDGRGSPAKECEHLWKPEEAGTWVLPQSLQRGQPCPRLASSPLSAVSDSERRAVRTRPATVVGGDSFQQRRVSAWGPLRGSSHRPCACRPLRPPDRWSRSAWGAPCSSQRCPGPVARGSGRLGTGCGLGLGLEGVLGAQGETRDRGQQPLRSRAWWEAGRGETAS